MKVLVIGSGGREHTLCWKIAQSPLVDEVFCAPGNGGIARDAICIDIAGDDIPTLLRFVKDNSIDLSVVGPEAPLVQGIVDAFAAENLAVFGPDRNAAALEGSKIFAKTAMRDCSIPTAQFESFSDAAAARAFIAKADFPIVVKADGLAAGKGVIVTSSKDEAIQAVDDIMVKREFGAAGASIVLEEKLVGEEASFIAICDGEHIVPLASSQDHKPAFDNDEGPNTGGMGAYSPAPVLDEKTYAHVLDTILYPLVHGLKKQGITYRGVIYAGLMITEDGPKVLEFNVRMGDPETQPLLMRLKSDIVPLLAEVANGGSIKNIQLEWETGPSVCVVLASGGYPGSYEKGKIITGIDKAEALDGIKVFHAGTRIHGTDIVTSGGRVLGVTAVGADLRSTIETAYRATELISFEKMYYRKDIGHKALKRLS
ncbi:MAG TPA: phosphoribosylamine--glycine ligase [Deltaproteobacteria bacterium]|nr:phosphoribosylamine--glycine ligase [Deltaproteobacteria bacterium]HPJ94446.1 phosphoribosylamine--glycine ligase [Deltaproteobacteria bacterium]HPR52415.1 phosphoribosylamine--glycine ligase [Deltaproteobacteria bacterium]